ncbi:MAG: aminotransferase class III-fold pyridoxal phosphate-dependent enzyme [Clostridiaceae bacterium]|nr:aminotransferase class III-fold pyridoxal phosphate-dependent enzyme [Clostridiaceae bacterium]
MEFRQRNEWNKRLIDTMPKGSSTASKAPKYLPEEPEVILRGRGCRVWDDKAHEFIDFRNALGPVTLGYCYPEVDQAITAQLKNGIIFGHPSSIECEVSEKLCEVIPCAEQARFLKTGGEACAAVIRIARAYTGRGHIIQIGYNGWLNSLAMGSRVLPNQVSGVQIPGVPSEISELYHAVKWNDIEGIRTLFDMYTNDIAAVIVAADYGEFEQGKVFYPFLRDITTANDAILIFDEIVTGFRVALGGVQEYFGVKPDLCVFAKGIANGMPLSVYAGKREIMQTCEKPGFSISSTYGGETLSLAACRAVIKIYKKLDVIGHIRTNGEYLWSKVNEIFNYNNIPIRLKGIPQCPVFTLTSESDKGVLDRFFRAAYANGVSLYNVSYVNLSHNLTDCDDAIQLISQAVKDL